MQMSTPAHPDPDRRHRPPHQLDRGEALFITASTFERRPHLQSPRRRYGLHRLLFERAEEFEIEISAWVLLKEHYHAVIQPQFAEKVEAWIESVHLTSSLRWNDEDRAAERRVWYQYWDRSLWTAGDIWSRVNYIHNNPVKHGYVSDPRQWKWSSIHAFDALACEEPEVALNLCRFPAPLKVRGDDF
jgi:putative transposase